MADPSPSPPGRAWSYNPGRDFALFDNKGYLPDSAIGLVANQRTFKDFGLEKLAETPEHLRAPTPERLPKATSFNAALTQLTTALAIPNKGWRRIKTPEGLDDVVIAKRYLPHVVEKRSDAREQFAHYILPTLTDPLEVWLTAYADGSFRRRFIKVFDSGNNQGYVIARENKDGSVFYNFVPISKRRATYVDGLRTGLLLYRKNKNAGNE